MAYSERTEGAWALCFHPCVDTEHGDNTGKGSAEEGTGTSLQIKEWTPRTARGSNGLLENHQRTGLNGVLSHRASWSGVTGPG